MRVNELPSGRYQPFYRSYSATGHTFCKSRMLKLAWLEELTCLSDVAQDNIMPIRPTSDQILAMYTSRKSFSRYFTGADFRPDRHMGRLTLSSELKTRFPEDDKFGREWVRSGPLHELS